MSIDWKELRDQAAHTVIGIGVVLLALVPGSAIVGALGGGMAGGLVGLLAEIKEEGGPVRLDMLSRVNWRDISFYAVGGLFAGWVF